MARVDPALRAVVLALRSRIGGKTADEVSQALGIPRRTVEDILSRAKKHGFDPTAPTFSLLPEYIEDAPRTGRPKKATPPVAESTAVFDSADAGSVAVGGAGSRCEPPHQ
ncbi:hypothetical protein LZ30DRAFT_246897 [Colletotrichum cereale]|nr:hypothetical protein LZ30DRAFT_246897 [Colletotrichum cereale]